RRAPGKRIESTAMRTQRAPIEALSGTARADIARVGSCADGAVEPLADGPEFPLLAFLEARHKLTDAWSRAGGQCVCQMAAGFAPELGIEGRLGQDQMAFARRRVLRCESLEGLDPDDRRLALVDGGINSREFGMGCGAPSAVDRL